MARNGDGTFRKGVSGNPRGRPPRNYSIAHALSVCADEPESVDDNGNPLTAAQVAARWLWGVVLRAQDLRPNPEGEGDVALPVGTRDRMEALRTILSRIEPPRNDDSSFDDDEARDMMERLKGLTDEELAVLEKLGTRV